ncbi:MAG: riboflavin synthase [Chitinophagaceae bacterium]|nr:riboflavin synthase [Chitinophagaceae bacterium]
MFTGIIEATGKVESITEEGSGRIFWISSPISHELKTDQSLSHNGACLTVEQAANNQHRVTAVQETLGKTNLGEWRVGDLVNLERCMQLNGRLDGHIVQGHVDTPGICTSVESKNGSWEYQFSFLPSFAPLVIEKGSICVNGISLTCYNVTGTGFTVAIIPYTYEHTNIKNVKAGGKVNLEFDMIGKYIQRTISLK